MLIDPMPSLDPIFLPQLLPYRFHLLHTFVISRKLVFLKLLYPSILGQVVKWLYKWVYDFSPIPFGLASFCSYFIGSLRVCDVHYQNIPPVVSWSVMLKSCNIDSYKIKVFRLVMLTIMIRSRTIIIYFPRNI